MANLIPGKRAYHFDRGGVRLAALIGGQEVHAFVSEEALQDATGEQRADPEALFAMVDSMTGPIEDIIQRKFNAGAIENGEIVITNRDLL